MPKIDFRFKKYKWTREFGVILSLTERCLHISFWAWTLSILRRPQNVRQD